MDINRCNAPYLLRLASRLFGEKSYSFLPVCWCRAWWNLVGKCSYFEYLWSRNISRDISKCYWAVDKSVAYMHMHFHICRHLCISPKGCYTANPSHCLFGSAAFGLKRKNHLSRFLVSSNYHNTPLCCNELFRMQPALCLLQSAF